VRERTKVTKKGAGNGVYTEAQVVLSTTKPQPYLALDIIDLSENAGMRERTKASQKGAGNGVYTGAHVAFTATKPHPCLALDSTDT